MDAFKLRIDWTCADAYPGDPVVVELHRLDSETWTERAPKVLRRFYGPTAKGDAAGWAAKWMEDRGFGFSCNINTAQRRNLTYLVLHPLPFGNRVAT